MPRARLQTGSPSVARATALSSPRIRGTPGGSAGWGRGWDGCDGHRGRGGHGERGEHHVPRPWRGDGGYGCTARALPGRAPSGGPGASGPPRPAELAPGPPNAALPRGGGERSRGGRARSSARSGRSAAGPGVGAGSQRPSLEPGVRAPLSQEPPSQTGAVLERPYPVRRALRSFTGPRSRPKPPRVLSQPPACPHMAAPPSAAPPG